jgi:hypothetical protein
VLVAVTTNQRRICSFTVTVSALYGGTSGLGLVFQVSNLIISVSISFSSFIVQVTLGKQRCFLQLVWLLSVWVVWNERNNMLFNNIHTTIEQLLAKIKFHSLWWLKANNASFVHDTQMWWSDPMLCLGID